MTIPDFTFAWERASGPDGPWCAPLRRPVRRHRGALGAVPLRTDAARAGPGAGGRPARPRRRSGHAPDRDGHRAGVQARYTGSSSRRRRSARCPRGCSTAPCSCRRWCGRGTGRGAASSWRRPRARSSTPSSRGTRSSRCDDGATVVDDVGDTSSFDPADEAFCWRIDDAEPDRRSTRAALLRAVQRERPRLRVAAAGGGGHQLPLRERRGRLPARALGQRRRQGEARPLRPARRPRRGAARGERQARRPAAREEGAARRLRLAQAQARPRREAQRAMAATSSRTASRAATGTRRAWASRSRRRGSTATRIEAEYATFDGRVPDARRGLGLPPRAREGPLRGRVPRDPARGARRAARRGARRTSAGRASTRSAAPSSARGGAGARPSSRRASGRRASRRGRASSARRPPSSRTSPSSKGAEIHVGGPPGAEIGCVRLRFHWDTDEERLAKEPSSCWVRVSQVFAGAGEGALWHPRVGCEVIVEHLDGDPDRPIVTGRVYNGAEPAAGPCVGGGDGEHLQVVREPRRARVHNSIGLRRHRRQRAGRDERRQGLEQHRRPRPQRDDRQRQQLAASAWTAASRRARTARRRSAPTTPRPWAPTSRSR